MGVGYVPDRGELVWLSFHPRQGREQSGRRPALVMSPKAYNRKARLALVCPVTSRTKGYPFEVALPEGLPASGVVLCDQLKSVDWRARRASRIARVPASAVEEAVARILTLLVVE
jgi:mRNA interferase MazF